MELTIKEHNDESVLSKEEPGLPKIVIIGGGFGGLYAAKVLSNKAVKVILIDRKNHHTFQPLLYQVAMAVLSPSDIAQPLRQILCESHNIEIILAEVTGLNVAKKQVQLSEGVQVDYDYLIVAAGSRHSYFGHNEWEQNAPGLKTVEDAVEIRRRMLLAFENAEREAYLTGKQPPLTFSVIGGGPTGVELAGAIADLARLALAKNFRTIDTKKARIRLFEGSPRVLGMYSKDLSLKAKQQLEELGVEVCTDSLVTAVEPGRIRVGDEWIPSNVTLWATGVAASSLGKELGVKTDRAGRVFIEQDLSIPGHPEVFVIGDMSTLIDANEKLVPGLGAAAMQQGKVAAENILRDLKGEKRLLFKYHDRGTIATIGHHRAVAKLGNREFSGFIAWLFWSMVHVFLLIGFRSRLAVMSEWFWSYLKREGSSPLITEHHSRWKNEVSSISQKD